MADLIAELQRSQYACTLPLENARRTSSQLMSVLLSCSRRKRSKPGSRIGPSRQRKRLPLNACRRQYSHIGGNLSQQSTHLSDRWAGFGSAPAMRAASCSDGSSEKLRFNTSSSAGARVSDVGSRRGYAVTCEQQHPRRGEARTAQPVPEVSQCLVCWLSCSVVVALVVPRRAADAFPLEADLAQPPELVKALGDAAREHNLDVEIAVGREALRRRVASTVRPRSGRRSWARMAVSGPVVEVLVSQCLFKGLAAHVEPLCVWPEKAARSVDPVGVRSRSAGFLMNQSGGKRERRGSPRLKVAHPGLVVHSAVPPARRVVPLDAEPGPLCRRHGALVQDGAELRKRRGGGGGARRKGRRRWGVRAASVERQVGLRHDSVDLIRPVGATSCK